MNRAFIAARRELLPAMRRATAMAAVLTVAVACSRSDLLQVEDPDVARPEALTGKEALPALLGGAQSDFQFGFAGSSNGDSQITISGLLSDELINAESFPTRIDVDQRIVFARLDNVTLRNQFRNLHRARASAERAVRRYEEFDPGTIGHAQVLILAAYSYDLFGENYCSGVPFSTLNDDGTITFGEQQTRDQVFQTAVSLFDQALGILTPLPASATRTAQINLANVGKGRALVNLARFPEAAAAVATVPQSFSLLVEHSENSLRQQNAVFTLINVSRRFSVPGGTTSRVFDREGINGLNFLSAGDPRVVSVAGTGTRRLGLDGETLFHEQRKYLSRSDDVVLASGIEAGLITAEAQLRAGQTGPWLASLNALRATGITPALPPLADPGTPGAREDLQFRERAFWLYLTSHRLGDLRRLIRQYGRGAETVFPTGAYHKGGQPYGTAVNLPLPDDESNNPNVAGGACLDTTA